MDRDREINVMAALLILLQDANSEEGMVDVFVKRRTLDFMADEFRRGGVDPHADKLGSLRYCAVCSRLLDPAEGDLFVGDDGNAYCNDHYEGDLADLELAQARAEFEHDTELDRKLHQRPIGGTDG